jgi:hypothetical protein
MGYAAVFIKHLWGLVWRLGHHVEGGLYFFFFPFLAFYIAQEDY